MAQKIPFRYRGILFALFMSATTAMIVSAIIIYLHSTSHTAFIPAWIQAFTTAWPIVFCAILVIAPQVNKLLNLFVQERIAE